MCAPRAAWQHDSGHGMVACLMTPWQAVEPIEAPKTLKHSASTPAGMDKAWVRNTAVPMFRLPEMLTTCVTSIFGAYRAWIRYAEAVPSMLLSCHGGNPIYYETQSSQWYSSLLIEMTNSLQHHLAPIYVQHRHLDGEFWTWTQAKCWGEEAWSI